MPNPTACVGICFTPTGISRSQANCAQLNCLYCISQCNHMRFVPNSTVYTCISQCNHVRHEVHCAQPNCCLYCISQCNHMRFTVPNSTVYTGISQCNHMRFTVPNSTVYTGISQCNHRFTVPRFIVYPTQLSILAFPCSLCPTQLSILAFPEVHCAQLNCLYLHFPRHFPM